MKSFYIEDGVLIPDKVILIDDIVDSGWTLTVCGYRLMESGCDKLTLPMPEGRGFKGACIGPFLVDLSPKMRVCHHPVLSQYSECSPLRSLCISG